MSADAAAGPQASPAWREPLEAAARALATAQQRVERAAAAFALPVVSRGLEKAQRHLARSPPADAVGQTVAEWFLDNYYLVRRVARQVEHELPPGFVRHLPRLADGPARGRPRIEAFARALLDQRHQALDFAVVRRFVDAYQEVSALTIAELWALPTLLRAALLQDLLRALEQLGVTGAEPARPEADGPLAARALGEAVERTIRALRVVDVLDWASLFLRTNRVEAILRTDPSQVYARMDFESRDAYRKVVEALAWATGRPEEAVATLAITLAVEAAPGERRGLVGCYLMGEGRAELEARLGYRAVGLERLRRLALRWPTTAYLVPLALLTWLPLLAVAAWLARAHGPASLPALVVAVAVALVPASAGAAAAVHFAFARLLPPRTLPKLDFSKGLPADARTLVVIPTLLGHAQEVRGLLQQLEQHYLSNPDPRLQFALLTDDLDATALPPEGSTPLLERAAAGVAALNQKHGQAGRGPFHLLHRAPQWNSGEQRFMGWERKRGKLEELNRLLRGDTTTSYALRVGAPEGLHDVRFVITLDSDTELPMGSAQRLVGLLAHPLNRAVFEPGSGRVVHGYTIVQPRVETSPSSARQTLFSRLFAGDVGFDPYTHATSELYQDLFGAGIYVGKGIYEVDAFRRSVEGRAPENALVSHDLFEGIHGRTALATDIVLFESYPQGYAAWALRLHRWLRGDWQLLPWLRALVPAERGAATRNSLALIDRWKIADNLRRSLTAPMGLVLLALGWLWLPGSPLAWTLGALAVHLAPMLPGLAGPGRRLERLGRGALAIAFLAYETAVVVDAIGRVLVRKLVTRRHLLQWTSAAHAALGVAARSPRATYWRQLGASPALALGLGALVAWLRPAALPVAAPLLLAWLLAPELARWVSQPPRPRAEAVTAADRLALRRLARRTWRFFDVFIGPNEQWLPIDNYQAPPNEQTAHRTSPTNIGLSLLAPLSAWDLGYLGPGELSLRLQRAFDSLARLAHYQGHLFNWYETTNLQPLLPRYVSTVDSGNLAGCLLALKQGCRDVASAPLLRAEPWEGLLDSVALLDEAVAASTGAATGPLRAVLAELARAAALASATPEDTDAVLRRLCDETVPRLDAELLTFLDTGAHRHEPELLQALRTATDQLHHQLKQMRRELDALLPWLGLSAEAAAHGLALPKAPRLDEVAAVAARARAALQASRAEPGAAPALDASAQRLDAALNAAALNASALVAELAALAARADEEVRGMDFAMLYDAERKLFRIGYNATVDQLDGHAYDLLASEARLASYVAIIKRDVPAAHWAALGRPLTSLDGGPALLSWGGTMFEYLMPELLMRSQPGTLLARTSAAVVDAQRAWGARLRAPWGVSESAYGRVDAEQTYQYRSFGVPGLGLKRGLEEDRVITPYASLLAVAHRPAAVAANVRALEALGMLGPYGLFEALDLDPEHAPAVGPGQRPATVVRSYMAHHQGMILVALGNLLGRRSMVDRFHADPLVQTGEVLLNERAPELAPTEWPLPDGPAPTDAAAPPPASGPLPAWVADEAARPQAFVLSNGRLSSLLTGPGGGGLRWQGLALTRYDVDATREGDGVWLYLRDDETRRVWRATSGAGRTTFSLHQAGFHLRHEGISGHVDVAVAPADDVEVRLVTLHNESGRRRRLTLTSAGRPVLFDAAKAPSHPAFSSLFVESERLQGLDALLFARRRQETDEASAVLVHRLVHHGPGVELVGDESDRGAFFGRDGTLHAPALLRGDGPARRGTVGAVLDPVMSLTAGIDLPPQATVTLAFVTTVGRSRGAALELARKYGSMHAVRWAFRDAEQEGPRRLQRANLEPSLLPTVQRLFSAMHFAEPSLRVPPLQRAATPPCQRRLWSRGISGDDPLVVVRVSEPQSPVLREVLAAQRFLRACGVRFELVLLDERATGYLTEASGTVRSALVEADAEAWLGRRGGVFVVVADQLAEAEVRHLEACARVLLDTRDGSLAARLERAVERPPALPRFEGTLAEVPDAAAARALPGAPRRFDNGLGGFSEDGREYVIDVVPGGPTPAPWSNVLANPEFGCVTSESSLGVTWSRNSGENRLTPWRNDPVLDPPSEVVYLRDEETAAVWSSTPRPAGLGERTRVRHGAGFTTYERQGHGLAQALTVFVPPDAPLKVLRLRLTNTLPRHRRLTATCFAEWVLGSRREAQRPFIVSAFDQAHACLLATCEWNAEFSGRVAFLAASRPAHGFTADRTEFLGRGGDGAVPEGLLRLGLSGRVDTGADPCAALQVHLELAPGETVEAHFLLGQAPDHAEALGLVAHYREPREVEAAWAALTHSWDELLGQVRVKTPEPAMDLVLNRWLLAQTVSARLYGRTGFYQSSGAFGFRDQLQDVLALLHAKPALARAHLLEAARHQFAAGDVLHWWHPPSGRGVRTRCSDDLAWLPYVAGEYVAATGDASVLDEPVPFLEGEPLRAGEHDRYAEYAASTGTASLFEHCRRALERALTAGAHGLPLMGDGDWNDGMSRIGREGRGESVWLGWFLCATMERFGALCRRRRSPLDAAQWQARARALRATLEAVAWDGAWYLRAFHDDGSFVGSAKSRECRIDSIAQTWAVLSRGPGDAPDERARAAVGAADAQLVRAEERLVLLFSPPFDTTRHDPGYIRGYPPGIRENGGQYTHAATWLGLAHVALGDGAAAARIFRLLNPVLQAPTAADVARYRVEPYVLAADIYGAAPWVGRGGWTWYTGSAAWLWRLGVEGILGLRLEDGALRLAPCIPPAWDGFEAWVQLGARTVHVVVENPEHVASGVASVTLDAVPLTSSRVAVDRATAGTHEVRVRLGAAAPAWREVTSPEAVSPAAS